MFLTALSLMLANFLNGEKKTKIRPVLYQCVRGKRKAVKVVDLARQ